LTNKFQDSVIVWPISSWKLNVSGPYPPDGQYGVSFALRVIVVTPAAWLTLIGCATLLKVKLTLAPLTVWLKPSCSVLINLLVVLLFCNVYWLPSPPITFVSPIPGSMKRSGPGNPLPVVGPPVPPPPAGMNGVGLTLIT